MNERELTIGIVGATGAVGPIALALLAERDHPPNRIVAMASARSAGRKLPYQDDEVTVIEATPTAFEEVDVAFISANSEVSRRLAPEAVRRGTLVIDDGSAFRMAPEVPLVVPEVNPQDVEWHSGILATPNCTTTPLAMVLAALDALSPITAVTVATYQSVTGTGAAARAELIKQTSALLDGREAKPDVYPHQIAFNVLPHVDSFHENGYTTEELKVLNETRKIMHRPDLPLSATCVRVPVEVSHSESAQIEFESKVAPEEAVRALGEFPGIALLDEPSIERYPMPVQAAGRNEVFVGRIRQDLAHENGLALWLSCDNLRKGAALNALQIMDECISRNVVRPVTKAPGRSLLLEPRRVEPW